MHFLITYIIQRFIDNRLADRKYTITILPCKRSVMYGKRFYPSAAIAFYLFNYVRDGYVT